MKMRKDDFKGAYKTLPLRTEEGTDQMARTPVGLNPHESIMVSPGGIYHQWTKLALRPDGRCFVAVGGPSIWVHAF